jgi:hypothetical protein
MDTLEFFPHNYQMQQLSSTDRLLMAAKDMTDVLQNSHPDVPFARVGDDTISALAELAAIFKLKLRQTPSPTHPAAPQTVIPHPGLSESSNQILNSPMPISRQTRSQTAIHTQDIPNAPLPPRVVTPRTLRPSYGLHYAIAREQDYSFLWPPDQKRFFSSKANRHSGPPNTSR